MNLQNFKFETDADGIGAADLGHAGAFDERHHAQRDGRARARDRRRADDAAIKGVVITSGKETVFRRRRSFHAAKQCAATIRAALKTHGEEAANKEFFDRRAAASRVLYRKLETAANPGPRRSTGCASAALSNWRSPAITASLAEIDKAQASACRKSRSGLFPGAGGTQRVRALMPTGDALQFLFKGEQIKRQGRQGGGPRA